MDNQTFTSEQHEWRQEPGTLARLESLTLEEKELCRVAGHFDHSVTQTYHQPLFPEQLPMPVLPTQSDNGGDEFSLMFSAHSKSTRTPIEDQDENRPTYTHPTTSKSVQHYDLLLQCPPSRRRLNRRSDPLRKTQDYSKITKKSPKLYKPESTRSWKISKARPDHFGRILKARENFETHITNLESMLSSPNEDARSKDDLDCTLTRRRRAILPDTARGRSRSLTSRGDGHGGFSEYISNHKLGTQMALWSEAVPVDFEHDQLDVSPSMSDCTTLLDDGDYVDMEVDHNSANRGSDKRETG